MPGLQKLVREAVARAVLSSKIVPHALLETLRRYARLTIDDAREAHRKDHPRERT